MRNASVIHIDICTHITIYAQTYTIIFRHIQTDLYFFSEWIQLIQAVNTVRLFSYNSDNISVHFFNISLITDTVDIQWVEFLLFRCLTMVFFYITNISSRKHLFKIFLKFWRNWLTINITYITFEITWDSKVDTNKWLFKYLEPF